MHFEVPKSKKFKEFGGEYVMIVISILTALALEHIVQTVHHRHLAQEASEKIEAELRVNAKEIEKVLAHNQQDLKEIERVRAELLKSIQDKTADGMLMARFQTDWKPGFVLGILLPALRHEAWDAALANQAVTWMPDEQLQRYTTAYAHIRDAQLFTGGIGFLDTPRVIDALSDLQMGAATPAEMFKTLTRIRSGYQSIDNNLVDLRKEVLKADNAEVAAH
jgi:hypothetical protein